MLTVHDEAYITQEMAVWIGILCEFREPEVYDPN